MSRDIRVFILHRHNLFRDVVAEALADSRVTVIGSTDSRRQAQVWVEERHADAAIVEIDDEVATRDDLGELFSSWSAANREFAVLGADLAHPGIEVYVHRRRDVLPGDIAQALREAVGAGVN